MQRTTRIKITELNPHLMCILCGGYFVDATTVIECLHSFCRACIVRYLESSKYCPICEVMVHKTRPLQNIRSDKTLQDLVYKLVPGLYRNEMKRRRDFYASHAAKGASVPSTVGEDRGDEAIERLIYTEDESISLSLELCTGVTEERHRFLTKENLNRRSSNKPGKDVRYLRCPAAVTVAHLKKFLRMKFDLTLRYEIDIFHTDEPLKDFYTLIDIAYIYTWRRSAPLRLFYFVYENGVKRFKMESVPSQSPERKPAQTTVQKLGHLVSSSMPSQLAAPKQQAHQAAQKNGSAMLAPKSFSHNSFVPRNLAHFTPKNSPATTTTTTTSSSSAATAAAAAAASPYVQKSSPANAQRLSHAPAAQKCLQGANSVVHKSGQKSTLSRADSSSSTKLDARKQQEQLVNGGGRSMDHGRLENGGHCKTAGRKEAAEREKTLKVNGSAS